METVVEATVPPDQFVLEETIERVSDVEFEFVRFAVHGSTEPMPFLWGSTGHPDRLDDALRKDPSTERVSCLSSKEGRGLYSIDWTDRAAELIERFTEAGGCVLDVRGTSDQWIVQTLFPDRSTASDAFQSWQDEDMDPTLTRVSNLSGRKDSVMGLSETQYSAILRAFQTDYYDVPRGTTLEELATDFEVSHQALSERLRRGHSHLVERMLSESAAAVERRP